VSVVNDDCHADREDLLAQIALLRSALVNTLTCLNAWMSWEHDLADDERNWRTGKYAVLVQGRHFRAIDALAKQRLHAMRLACDALNQTEHCGEPRPVADKEG
jgi:hypothetical protein